MQGQLRRWLGRGVLGTMLVSGCSHASSNNTLTAPLASNAPVVSQSAPAYQAPAYQAPAYQAPSAGAAPVAVQQAVPVRIAGLNDPAPPSAKIAAPVQQVAAWQSAGDAQPVKSTAAAPVPVAPATVEAPAAAAGDLAQPRRSTSGAASSFGHATDYSGAASSFGHATDYSWLAGQVEKTRLSNGWRLRYATVDEDDPHGGSVTLIGDAVLPTLKDGQYVHVRGHLLEPQTRSAAPAYRVDTLEPTN